MKSIYIFLGVAAAALVVSFPVSSSDRQLAEKMARVMHAAGIKVPKAQIVQNFLKELKLFSFLSHKFNLAKLFDYVRQTLAELPDDDLLGDGLISVFYSLEAFRDNLEGKIGILQLTTLDRSVSLIKFIYFRNRFIVKYSTINKYLKLRLSEAKIYKTVLGHVTHVFEIGLALGYDPINEYNALNKALEEFEYRSFENAIDAYLRALEQLVLALAKNGAVYEDTAFLTEEIQTLTLAAKEWKLKKYFEENANKQSRDIPF